MPDRDLTQRLVVALLAGALLVYACGPRTGSSEARRDEGSVAGDTVAASFNVRVGAPPVAFTFLVTNNSSRRLELSFTSGQTHDIAVLDSLGQEVWRWSAGRLFTQAIQNAVLETSETLTYEAEWTPAPTHRGTFVAVATLLSEDHPLEQRVTFAIP